MDEFKDRAEIREYVIKWLSSDHPGKDAPEAGAAGAPGVAARAGLGMAGHRVEAILKVLQGETNEPGAPEPAPPPESAAYQTKSKEI